MATIIVILLVAIPMGIEFYVWWAGIWWHSDPRRDPRNGL
jgi:hypothetical protein